MKSLKKKKITTIISLMALPLLFGGACATIITSCGNPKTTGNLTGTDWEGWISGTLTIESIEDTNNYQVVGNNNYVAKNLVIPSKVIDNEGNEHMLTRIDDRAFEGANITHSLSIANSITHIGEYAFKDVVTNQDNADAFLDLTLPVNEELTIGEYAFFNVVLKSIKNNLNTTTGNYTFYGTSSKRCILLDGGDESTLALIGCIVVWDNLELNSIVLQGRPILANAFKGCSGLNGSLTLDSTIASIGNNAFDSCNRITSLMFTNFTTAPTGWGNDVFAGWFTTGTRATLPCHVSSDKFDWPSWQALEFAQSKGLPSNTNTWDWRINTNILFGNGEDLPYLDFEPMGRPSENDVFEALGDVNELTLSEIPIGESNIVQFLRDNLDLTIIIRSDSPSEAFFTGKNHFFGSFTDFVYEKIDISHIITNLELGEIPDTTNGSIIDAINDINDSHFENGDLLITNKTLDGATVVANSEQYKGSVEVHYSLPSPKINLQDIITNTDLGIFDFSFSVTPYNILSIINNINGLALTLGDVFITIKTLGASIEARISSDFTGNVEVTWTDDASSVTVPRSFLTIVSGECMGWDESINSIPFGSNVSELVMPVDVTSVTYDAFASGYGSVSLNATGQANVAKIKKIRLQNTGTVSNSFHDWRTVDEIYFNHVANVEHDAFKSMSGLLTLDLGSNLNLTLSNGSFQECGNLKMIYGHFIQPITFGDDAAYSFAAAGNNVPDGSAFVQNSEVGWRSSEFLDALKRKGLSDKFQAS